MNHETPHTTGPSHTTGSETREEDALDELRRAGHATILRTALALEDPAHVRDVPVYPGATYTEQRARPTTELRAATLLADFARGQTRQAALKARAAGIAWADIAPALDLEINGEPDASRYDLGIAAFEAIAGPRSMPYDRLTVGFACDSCGKWVTDRGPHESHPEDNESGHDPTCTPFRALVAAWRERHPD